MIRWNVTKHMRRKGWTRPYDLFKHAGIPRPTARRVVDGEAMRKLDTPTLEALGRAFHLKRAKLFTLLEHVPD